MLDPCTQSSRANDVTFSDLDRSAARTPGTACAFCAELESKTNIVGEFGTVLVLLDRYPVAEGHLLILPRRHVEQLFDLSDVETLDSWRSLKALRSRYIELDPTILGFNIGANVGKVAGQTIPHAHIHLIPRREGDTPDPKGGVRGVIPERRSY